MNFSFPQLLCVDGIKRQLHLVNRDAVGIQIDGLLHVVFPALPGLADHAGDQVDIELIEIKLVYPGHDFKNFFGKMGTTVLF